MSDRIDNRPDDILAELMLDGAEPTEDGDSELFADAYDDLLDGALSSGARLAVQVELATAQWLEQGDPAGAAARFRQVQALDPANQVMLDFFRAEYGAGDRRRILVGVLAAAVQASDDGRLRDELVRLLEELGKWRELIRLLEREIDALPPEVPAAKIAFYQQIASVYGNRLRQDAMVVQTYRAILAIDSAHGPTLEALGELFETKQRWKDLVEVLLVRVEHAWEPAERRELLLRVARLCLDHTGDPQRAYDVLEQAVELDPGHTEALELLAAVCERRRSWPQLFEVLERQAALRSGAERAGTLARMATIAAEYLARPDRAVELWRAVLELAPEDDAALASLERLTERQGDWEGAARLIEHRLARASRPAVRIALLTRLGRLCADKLQDAERAAESWRRILEIDPGHEAARQELVTRHLAAERWGAVEQLYLARGDIEGLANALSGAAERHAQPAVKLQLWLRCAELYDDLTAGADKALSHYQRALDLDPSCAVAARALTPTFRRRGEWSRLADALVALGDFAELERLLPDDQELSPFVEKAATLGKRWAALVLIYEHRRAGLDPAGKQWQELTYQIGELSQRRLGDGLRAIEVLAELLEQVPGEPRVIALLKRLLDDPDVGARAARLLRPHLRERRSWPQLTRVLEILIEHAEEADEQQQYRRELIEVLAGQGGKEQEALAASVTLLEERPGDRQLWDRLIALGARDDLAEQVAEQLGQAYWSAGVDAAGKIALANRLARFIDRELGRPDQAEVYYWRVLKAEPANAEALEALENNYTVAGRWNELQELFRLALEGEPVRARAVELRHKICRISDEILGDVPRAIEAYRELLEIEPEDAEARIALERLYETAGCWKELYGLLYGRLEGTTGASAARLRLELGAIAERRLGRPDAALIFYGQALAADRGSAPAREALRGLLEKPQTRLGAARLLREVAETDGDDAAVADMLTIELTNPELPAAQRVQLLLRLAELREHELDDAEGAVVLYRRLLGHAQSFPAAALAAASGLARHLTVEGAPDELLEALEVKNRFCAEPGERVQTLLRMVELQEAAGAVDDAIETYHQLVELDGEDTRALEQLELLLEREKRWLELIDVLRHHARVEPSKEKRSKLFERVTRLASRLA